MYGALSCLLLADLFKSFLISFQSFIKFQLMPMGVLDPGSAHDRPSVCPSIDMSGNFPPGVSADSPSNIFPNQ